MKERIIYFSAFVTALSEGIVTLGIIFYIKDVYNASAGTIGWIGSMWAFFYFVGCLTLKPLLKILPPHRSMTISGILMAFFLLLTYLVRNLTLLFIFYSMFGLSLSLFWPQAMGWMSAGAEGKLLGKKIGFYNLSWSSGLILSPLISGALSQASSSLPLIVSLILFLLNSTVILLLIKKTKYRGENLQAQGSQETSAGDRSTPLRYPAWIGLFSTYFTLGVIVNVFPIFARESLHISKTLIGTLLLIRSLSTTLIFIFLGKFKFWHFNPRVIILGQILLLTAVMGMIFTRNIVTTGILMLLFGIIFALNYNLSIFHGVSGSSHRAARMAIHEAILTLGIVSGSTAGGFILQDISMKSVYLVCSALAVTTLIVQALVITKQNHRQHPTWQT